MGRIYTVSYNGNLANSGPDPYDALNLIPADDKPITLRGLLLSQNVANGLPFEQTMQLAIFRSSALALGTGSTPTPIPMNSSDAAAGFSVSVNNSSPSTGGTLTKVGGVDWPIRFPLIRWFPTRMSLKARGAEGLVIGTPTLQNLGGPIVVSYTFWVEEE